MRTRCSRAASALNDPAVIRKRIGIVCMISLAIQRTMRSAATQRKRLPSQSRRAQGPKVEIGTTASAGSKGWVAIHEC